MRRYVNKIVNLGIVKDFVMDRTILKVVHFFVYVRNFLILTIYVFSEVERTLVEMHFYVYIRDYWCKGRLKVLIHVLYIEN